MQTGEITSAYDEALKLIVDNPKITAATLLNMLKVNGFSLTKPSKESDNSSSNAQVLSPGVKKESATFKFTTLKLVEKDAKDDGIGATKFKAILIQEGLGNLRDRFYYSREALESAIPVFEGKKIYADHPSSQEEQTRPERSVKDVLGYFENVGIEETTEGRSILTGEVKILDDMQYAWARGLMRNSIEYAKKFPDKDFIGLSINASGDAEEISLDDFVKQSTIPASALLKLEQARNEGVVTIRLVSKINDAVSCDLVTEAGAGGKVLQMIEKEKGMAKKKDAKVKENLEELLHPAATTTSGQDDAASDAELIKKLHGKLGGDEGSEMDESTHSMACEALAMAKAKGLQGEEALKCAEYGMHMMKHMAAKKEAGMNKESENKESKVEQTKETVVETKKEEVIVETKESDELLQLKGENASLKEQLHKIEVEKYLDTKLRESKLPMSVTKDFRESLGAVKSEKEIDRAFDMFMKGYKNRSESEDFGPLVLNVEKSSHLEEGKDKLSLTDCIRN